MAKLFSGSRFFFYPSKSLHRLNSIKATACAKQGAQIQTKLNAETTHIIVAPSGNTKDFWDLVNGSLCRATIVNDRWPSDCIDQHRLLDTDDYAVYDPRDSPIKSEETDNTKDISEETSKQAEQSENPRGNDIAKHNSNSVKRSPPSSDSDSSPTKKAKHEDVIFSSPEPESQPLSPQKSQGKFVPENQIIIEVFHDLMLSRQAAGEEFSERGYERALKALESVDEPIESGEQARKLTNITPKMAQLIDDIRAGKVRPISKTQRDRVDTIQSFTTVFGIGTHHARKLYDEGYRTSEDIRPILDKNGQVSIDHHQDYVERIARTEVSQHYEAVKRLVAELDPNLQAYCMGSYRRGQSDCGDIDIVSTKKDATLSDLNRALKELLSMMFDTKLATYTFIQGSDRWLGSTQVIGKWRRMDILLVPWAELGAAMIYYTGNDQFNRKLRLKAKRNHMRLSQNGLFRILPSGKTELIEAHDEEKIFDILHEPYVPPDQRII